MSSDYVPLSGQGKCPSRPLSYHRNVIRGTCPWVRIMGGLLASAYLRTVFLWMPKLPGDCPNGEAPKLSLLHGLPPDPLSRRGFPAWRCRRLRTLPPPFNVALSASMASRDAKLPLGWLPTPLTLRSRPGPYRRGPLEARRTPGCGGASCVGIVRPWYCTRS